MYLNRIIPFTYRGQNTLSEEEEIDIGGEESVES